MFKKTLLLLSLSIFFTSTIFSQRGVLGSQTITNLEEWVNTYTYLTANANIGATSLTVDDNNMSGAFFTTALDAGDLLLIIQMQGASMDVNTNPIGWGSDYTAQNSWSGFGGSNPDWDPSEYGQVLNYNNAGNFEYVEVAAVTGGNTIELNCALTKNYTASGHVQVIRVPRFENLIVQNGASIEAPLWNGTSGGVVAIEVNQDLTLNGTGRIDVSEMGFRGGLAITSFTTASGPGSAGYLGSPTDTQGSEKGEGIGGFYSEYDALFSRYCRGALANGGGGSNYHNAGGGGGSNVGVGTYTSSGVPDPGATNEYVTAWNLDDPNLLANPSSGGGRGGYSHATTNNDPLVVGPNDNAWDGDFRRLSFGVGGHALTYSSDRIFMGGGGGGGHQNDGQGGDGGRGGGIVMLKVYGEVIGNGSVLVNGEDGGDATGPAPGFGAKTGDDGSGGAGGGGSIHIEHNNSIPSTINLLAEGGNGGNQNLQLGVGATNQADGPGGGGAGGMISFSNGTPNESVAGGAGGTTNSGFVSNFPFNGATGGASGMGGLSVDFFDLLVENDTLCGGATSTLTATVIGSLPSGAQIEWYDSQYGGSVVGTGSSFTTPTLTNSTSYFVGTCPGTFRKEVQVVVSPVININGTASITDETCAGNDGSILGLNASGGTGVLAYDWNGVTTVNAELTNAVGGSYTLTVTDELGCTETAGPFVINASPGPSIDVTNMVITNESCNGNDGSIVGISATGTGLVFEWNGVTYPSEDLIGVVGDDYTLVVTDANSCTSTVGPFTVGTASGPSVDISNIAISDESCFENDGSINGITASGTNLSYEWNGVSSTNADLEDAVAGSYSLAVTDNTTGCTTTVGPFDIDFIPGPSIDETNLTLVDEACDQGNGSITGLVASGSNISFEWNGNLETSENLNDITGGSYTLIVTDDVGCTATSGPHIVANLDGPEIDLSNLLIQDESCFENDGEISGINVNGNGLVYTWNVTENTPTPDYTGLDAGTYVLQVEDENGCTAEAGPFEVNYNPGPSIDDTNLEIFDETCQGTDGGIFGLDVTGTGLEFEWNGTVTTSADLENISVGNYSLLVTDENGCTADYGPVAVQGVTPPSIVVSSDTTIESGETADLSIIITSNEPGTTIEWFPADDLSCFDCANPEASPTETTDYIVTVTNEDGCVLSDTVTVYVENICGDVFVPTIFSPNGDGKNDDLCVLGPCIETMQFEVFNRWGERVFYSESQQDCWNGTFKGELLNTGVFVYKLTGTLIDGKVFNDAGNVSIVK